MSGKSFWARIINPTVLIAALAFLVGVTSASRLVQIQCAMAAGGTKACCPAGAHDRAGRRAQRPTPATPVTIGVGDCCSVMSVSTTSVPSSMLANPPAPAGPAVATVVVVLVAPPPVAPIAMIVPAAVDPPPRSPRLQTQIRLL